MAREAGAKRVYFASASPAVRFPNVYGIDMPAASELVAAERTDAEVGKLIGADWLIYQNLEDLIGSVRYDNSEIDEFDTSCFSGKYVTGDVTEAYLSRIESERSDGAKSNREALRRRLDGESDDGDLAAGSDDAMDSQAGVG
jgi:amidophosphoribosyltransferase